MNYQISCMKHGTVKWATTHKRALEIAKEHDNKVHGGHMFCSVIRVS